MADRIVNFISVFLNSSLMGISWLLYYTGMPIEPAVILASLMAIDFFAGIGKSISLGIPITSHRVKVGVLSKMSVLFIPLVVAITAKGLGADFEWLVGWSISIFILSEAYSIIANVYSIKTLKDAPEWDVMSILLRKIRSLIDSVDTRQ